MIEAEQASAAPPQPEGRAIKRFAKIEVKEAFDLDTGYSRSGWYQYMWLGGWRATVAVYALKLLNWKYRKDSHL